jgi:hypothetical protein
MIPFLFPFFKSRSASALKKLTRISLRTPLPLLLRGIPSVIRLTENNPVHFAGVGGINSGLSSFARLASIVSKAA